jgi:hypothetical protein
VTSGKGLRQPDDATMIEDEIRRILDAKADALIRRDPKALDTLLDAGFVYLNASGRALDKVGYIETYCVSDQVVFLSQQITDLHVTPHDGFAIATLTLHDRFEVHGRVVEGNYRSLCVFRITEGSWRWTAGQTMPAPPR